MKKWNKQAKYVIVITKTAIGNYLAWSGLQIERHYLLKFSQTKNVDNKGEKNIIMKVTQHFFKRKRIWPTKDNNQPLP